MSEIAEESKVKYNFVGKSGLRVSNICSGALTFGKSSVGLPGQCDESLSHQLLDRYVAWGGNFLDTADLYGYGHSEKLVGTWLERQCRENIVIATKCRADMGTEKNKNNVGLSRRHITASIEKSLERLRTHYVDLYQTHIFDNATHLEETYRTLDDLVRCGKIRYVGVSNVSGWQLQKIVQIQERLGFNPIISLQQEYSLINRESELEPFQVCKNEGIGVLPWSPLKGGLLTGKVKRNVKPMEGRLGWSAQDEKRHDQACPTWEKLPSKVFDIIETAEAIAKKHGRTIAQVSLRWLLQKDVVTSIIIGARTLAQLDQNMALNDWTLSAEEMKQLDKVSSNDTPYPYDLIFKVNADRLNTYANDYFTHIFDNATHLEETYRTLDDLVRCGKIRYVGVSNVSGWQLQKIVQIQERLGFNPIISLQQQYSLINRESELEPFQVCKNEGIGVLPWSPLKGGLLTGKVKRNVKPTEGRLGWSAQDEKRHDQACPTWEKLPSKVFDIIETAEAIAKKHDRTIAQVSLRWLLQKDVVTSIIIGARTLAQLDQNMAVNEWKLCAEEMKQLDKVSSNDTPYPYDLIFKVNADRVNTYANDYFVKSLDV